MIVKRRTVLFNLNPLCFWACATYITAMLTKPVTKDGLIDMLVSVGVLQWGGDGRSVPTPQPPQRPQPPQPPQHAPPAATNGNSNYRATWGAVSRCRLNTSGLTLG